MKMEWQPIETAPKNEAGKVSGEPILVWCGYNNIIYHAFWTTGLVNGSIETGWFIWSSTGAKYPVPRGRVVNCADQITHWMPLPKPPK